MVWKHFQNSGHFFRLQEKFDRMEQGAGELGPLACFYSQGKFKLLGDIMENKGWYEDFSGFFENPSREKLRKVIKNNLGEFDNLDFKKEFPIHSKMGRHILAMANAGGGCIIVGINEEDDHTFDVIGANEIIDKSDIHNNLKFYLPDKLKYEVINFDYQESEYPKLKGKQFQVLFVEDTPQYIPFISKKDGEGISENTIYVRKGTESIAANYEDLQMVLNRRLETMYTSKGEFALENHLSELRTLYSSISKYKNRSILDYAMILGRSNPKYPDEDFDSFVSRLIASKKEIIEKLIRN